MLLQVLRSTTRDGVQIEVVGEMDYESAPRVLSAVIDAVHARPHVVVLDLHQVGYMDSAGLAEVVRAHRVVDHAGGHLVVSGASAMVRRLFETTGVDRVVDLDGAAD